MRLFVKSFGILLFMVTLLSCQQRVPISTTSSRGPGYENVRTCSKDSTQSYWLFEPDGFPGEEKWPVIFCFDPHGDGKLAVDHFKEFAQENGYLVIGSNNARNGLQTMEYTVKTLYDEILHNFPVDQNRIYMSGFSGGGRVALSLGFGWPGIRGVITCGAGASGLNPASMAGKPAVFALAGDGDFNYPEVEGINKQFEGSGIPVFTRIFHGTHAWPSASELARSMQWMQLECMKKGMIPKDNERAKEWAGMVFDSALLAEKLKDPLEALKLYQLGASMLNGLAPLKEFNEAVERIQNSTEYKEFTREAGKISMLENKAREEYGKAILDKDTAWWRKEVNALQMHRKSNEGPSWNAMFNRLFGFMSIMAYTYSNRSLQAGDTIAARRFVTIYGIIDPDNQDYLNFKKQVGL